MDENSKKFIYIGNIKEKKTFFNLSMIDFFVTIILGVFFGMISLKLLKFQFLIIPIGYFLLNVKILAGKTSIFYWIKVALNYLVLSQQEYRWGRRKEKED